MLNNYQDINEDELTVSGDFLVATTVLKIKFSGARANIIATLDARHNGLVATSIPFTRLSTMLIHHAHPPCSTTYLYPFHT
jgi:hypothetical protein